MKRYAFLFLFAAQAHGFEKSLNIDLQSPIGFLSSPVLGFGPYFDIKPSLKVKTSSENFWEIEGTVGLLSSTAVFQYYEPVTLDSSVIKGPEIIGMGYGCSGSFGKKLFEFGRISSQAENTLYLKTTLGYSAFRPKAEHIARYRTFFGKDYRKFNSISLGSMLEWEIKTQHFVPVEMGVGYFVSLNKELNYARYLANYLPYLGLDFNFKVEIPI